MLDGDLGAYGTARDALMKQKHRMIWERRHGTVGTGMKHEEPMMSPFVIDGKGPPTVFDGFKGRLRLTYWFNVENVFGMRIKDGTDHISSYPKAES